jgi:hypothetical protein
MKVGLNAKRRIIQTKTRRPGCARRTATAYSAAPYASTYSSLQKCAGACIIQFDVPCAVLRFARVKTENVRRASRCASTPGMLRAIRMISMHTYSGSAGELNLRIMSPNVGVKQDKTLVEWSQTGYRVKEAAPPVGSGLRSRSV